MELIKTPIKINKLELHNRIVMAPMATSKANFGEVSHQLIDYYDEKAKGGYIGLIITEHLYIRHDGMADPGQISISKDSDIVGLKKLVDTIHHNGCKVIAQISHAGSAAKPSETGYEPISASAIIHPGSAGKLGITPREMTKAEIKEIVNDFAEAALRSKKAGFDGVELHSAHSYLLNQFYSPLSNKRQDEYGGSLTNRILIHQEIIKAVRAKVGNDYVIAMRLGASDYMDGGSSIDDGAKAACLLSEVGLDLLDVSGGFGGFKRDANAEPGYFSDATVAIKKEVDIPIILTGGISDKASAEKLLQEKKADLIGIGRALLKDSAWAKKVIEE